MTTLTGAVRRHPLTFFVTIACLLGWSIFIAAALGAPVSADNMPLGPLMAALVVASCQGRENLSAWWWRLRSWGAAPRWYAFAVLTPLAIHVVDVLVNHLFGAPLPTATQLAGVSGVPAQFLVAFVMVGIGEEAGWSAFAAPVLLRRHGLYGAWALLSAMRILWHLPLMLTGMLPWVVGIVGNAAFQMIVLMILRGAGRWTPVAVWHATLNAFGGVFFFTMVQGADRARLGVLLAIAYALVAGAMLAWSRRGRAHPVEADEPVEPWVRA